MLSTPISILTPIPTYLSGLEGRHARPDLGQAFTDKQGSVDKHAVGRAVDLEVAEQDIGPEKGQDLVHAVVRLALRRDIDVEGVGG